MNEKAFIITLTGPSACGKGLITQAIIEVANELKEDGIHFQPKMIQKDVTRSYRFKEAYAILNGNSDQLDVNSVNAIPDGDDLVYRTYGDEYALSTSTLNELLEQGISPIVVINDIRVVEEMKRIYRGKVLSLFIFRHIIPDLEQHKKAGAERGGVSSTKIMSRYEKAVALYRVFIENIQIFDRVILNVQEGKPELAKLQATNIIKAVCKGEISLDKKIVKGPKLFIISGNAASGKDDIIKAAKSYGKHQADILIKSTSRWQEDGDVGEIVCKFIPKKEKVAFYQSEYEKELDEINNELERILSDDYYKIEKNAYSENLLEEKFKEFKENNVGFESLAFNEYLKTQFFLDLEARKKRIPDAIQRFWMELKKAQDLCLEREAKRLESLNKKTKEIMLPKSDYEKILTEWFEQTDDPNYIRLDEIREKTKSQRAREIKKIKDDKENKSWLLKYEGKKFIFYENNLLYGKHIRYGFEIGKFIEEWKKRKKHLVLTVSLPNVFKICKEEFGKENVITAFTYSQISKKEHEEHADAASGKAKSKEYDDIERYARHIVDFDYALIYAETSLTNLSGNQKDELVDQMFRLFRVYNLEE